MTTIQIELPEAIRHKQADEALLDQVRSGK